MKWLISIACYLCFLVSNSQEISWTGRLGAVGTGTFDEGLWYFREEVGLGPQKFIFSNSWGMAFDADINYHPSIVTGVHISVSHMSLDLEILDNGFLEKSRDNLAVGFMLIEQRYRWRPDCKFQPTAGVSGGWMLMSNADLTIQNQETRFNFKNPFVFGMIFGFEYDLGKNWSFHSLIRALTFHFTTEPTDVTYRQMLLDQVWWMNYNHIQLGVGKTF